MCVGCILCQKYKRRESRHDDASRVVRNKREWAKRETLENYSIGMMTSSISREMARTNALRGIQNRNARLTVSDVLLQRPSDNSELVRGQVIRP